MPKINVDTSLGSVDMHHTAGDALAQHGAGALQDFSLLNMFWSADLFVQIIMVALLLTSFWAWAMILSKSIMLRRVKKDTANFESRFWSGASMDDLFEKISRKPTGPTSYIFLAAMNEWKRTTQAGGAKSTTEYRNKLLQRIERVMDIQMMEQMEILSRRMSYLASIGSATPFVGLLGTVWGIMNSFQGIAASKNTSLAVVAPGIAEALFATALGLIAAIPAVLAYNKIASELGRLSTRFDAFIGEFVTLIAHQLEEQN